MEEKYNSDEEQVRRVFSMLRAAGETFASAESCTGGNIAHRITLIPGSSDVFAGAVVSYATRVKVSVLGVPQDVIDKEGVVSCATAEAMAEGVRRLMCTDYAVSTTGVAGPSGGTESTPVGTVCIAVSSRAGVISKRCAFGSDRKENIRLATIEAYKMLLEVLKP